MNAPNRAPGNGACRPLRARLPILVAAILFARATTSSASTADEIGRASCRERV